MVSILIALALPLNTVFERNSDWTASMDNKIPLSTVILTEMIGISLVNCNLLVMLVLKPSVVIDPQSPNDRR